MMGAQHQKTPGAHLVVQPDEWFQATHDFPREHDTSVALAIARSKNLAQVAATAATHRIAINLRQKERVKEREREVGGPQSACCWERSIRRSLPQCAIQETASALF
jgi:hypothetical protein